MPGHVFISYHKGDRDYVNRLAAHLESSGVPVWHDFSLIVGDEFPREIERQIRDCLALLVVLTPEALASPWVNKEISYAVAKRKPIFPLELRAVEEIGIELINVHREKVLDGQMPPPGLLARLRGLVGPPLADAPVPSQTAPPHAATAAEREARRAELERVAAMARDVAFRKPPWGKRGYDEQDVDEFIDRVVVELLHDRPAPGELSAWDIRNVAFRKPPIGRPGYDEEEVDGFLDEIERAFTRLFPDRRQ